MIFSANYVHLGAVISVVAFIFSHPTTVSSKKITIQGGVFCNMSCTPDSQSPQPISQGIIGAEVRVACSNGTHYAQVQTKSGPARHWDSTYVGDGFFQVGWPESEEAMFSSTKSVLEIMDPDNCTVYVDYIPDYLSLKCNLAVKPQDASKGYKMFMSIEGPNQEQIYDASALVYYPPCGAQCP